MDYITMDDIVIDDIIVDYTTLCMTSSLLTSSKMTSSLLTKHSVRFCVMAMHAWKKSYGVRFSQDALLIREASLSDREQGRRFLWSLYIDHRYILQRSIS